MVLAVTFASPAASAPFDNWSGGYIGIEAGYGSASLSNSLTDAVTALNVTNSTGLAAEISGKGSGALGGFRGGFDWQRANAVFGVSAGVSLTGIAAGGECDKDGDGDALFSDAKVGCTLDQRVTALADLRARVGLTAGSTLFYAAAGVALAQIDNTWTGVMLPSAVADLTPARYTTTDAGSVLAAGIEHTLGPHLSLAAEYDLYDLRGVGNGGADAAAMQEHLDLRDETHLVIQAATLRLSYRFGGGE